MQNQAHLPAAQGAIPAVPNSRAGAVGLLSDVLWCKALLVAAHGGMALALWRRAQTVDTASHSSLTGFYMFIWKLFYLEYLVLPAFGLIH